MDDEILIPFYDESENLADPNSTSDEIPTEERHLRTQAYDKSVSDLIRMIRDEDIILNVEYQRNYIWDNKKASLLIESILINIPIPIIYASEESDNSWNIVDGLQRLTAIKKFYENNFKLQGLEILQELNGFKYEDLAPKAKRILNNGILRIILIFHDSHPEIKYDIFMRLNTGSVKLKEQELRNCLYRGKFNELLKDLRKNVNLLKILGLREPHKRMDDVELILRYFAFSENYDFDSNVLKGYKGKIKTFLNNYMSQNKEILAMKEVLLRNKFEKTIDKVFAIFGENAFRKLDPTYGFDGRINRSIMDVIMLSFERYDKIDLIDKKDEITSLYSRLPLEDRIFDESITIGTSDITKVSYRLKKWINQLRIIMGS